MFFNTKFILASASLSRYEILKKNKLSFFRILPSCNEALLKKKLIKNKLSAKKISLELARLKSKNISNTNKKKLVVGSDTVISLGGIILNKAKNLKEASNKIYKLSGKTHYIFSSASVFYNNKEIWSDTQKSEIKIRNLSKKEIDNYVTKAGKKILNSIGCYHVENLGPNIIEEIKGDFFNVMGFPLFPFLKFLKKYENIKKND